MVTAPDGLAREIGKPVPRTNTADLFIVFALLTCAYVLCVCMTCVCVCYCVHSRREATFPSNHLPHTAGINVQIYH